MLRWGGEQGGGAASGAQERSASGPEEGWQRRLARLAGGPAGAMVEELERAYSGMVLALAAEERRAQGGLPALAALRAELAALAAGC